jgi:hypothetical protein
MKTEPQDQHKWLHRMIGDWNCEGEAEMAPGQPPVTWKSTETVRSLGGVWVIGEGLGQTPDGGESKSVMTLGYDTAKQRFVGTFVANMMTNLWVYEGMLEGNVLTLDTEGPRMDDSGAIAKYQDIVEIQSDNERTLTSRMQGPDGDWTTVMSMRYTRRR